MERGFGTITPRFCNPMGRAAALCVFLLCEFGLALRAHPALTPRPSYGVAVTRLSCRCRHTAVRLCEELSTSIEAGSAETAEVASPASAAKDSWTLTEVASGTALFVLLHSIAQSGASMAGPSEAAVASALLFSTATFVAVQQAAGLPASSWLPRGSDDRQGMQLLQSPLAPLGACALFAFAAFAPSIGLTATGHAAEAQALLPSARPLPGPGGAFELLVAAPITEEIFVLPRDSHSYTLAAPRCPQECGSRESVLECAGSFAAGCSRACLALESQTVSPSVHLPSPFRSGTREVAAAGCSSTPRWVHGSLLSINAQAACCGYQSARTACGIYASSSCAGSPCSARPPTSAARERATTLCAIEACYSLRSLPGVWVCGETKRISARGTAC